MWSWGLNLALPMQERHLSPYRLYDSSTACLVAYILIFLFTWTISDSAPGSMLRYHSWQVLGNYMLEMESWNPGVRN